MTVGPRQALGLIASGMVPVEDLITHRLPLELAVEGIHTVARGEAMKVTVEPTGPVGESAGRNRSAVGRRPTPRRS